jgi:hypothetical protein
LFAALSFVSVFATLVVTLAFLLVQRRAVALAT